MIGARLAEVNEVIKGEVVRDGDDEEERGSRARVWERGVRCASEEVSFASALAEFRVRVRI